MRGGYRQGAGRKKGFAAKEAEKARELLVEKLSLEFGPIVDKAIEQAKNGDQRAREWLSNRAFGRVPAADTEEMRQANVEIVFDSSFSENQLYHIAKRSVQHFEQNDLGD